ncbi:hypothetical protein PO909_032680, partial [Leuciscus waleckii]
QRRKTSPISTQANRISPLFRVRKEHLVPKEDRKVRESIGQHWRTPDNGMLRLLPLVEKKLHHISDHIFCSSTEQTV